MKKDLLKIVKKLYVLHLLCIMLLLSFSDIVIASNDDSTTQEETEKKKKKKSPEEEDGESETEESTGVTTEDGVVFDNDGKKRDKDKIYGDSKLPATFDADYFDCYVPYTLTPADIGGYSTGVLAYTTSVYNYSMKSYYPNRINQRFAYLVNGYQPMGSTVCGGTVHGESGTSLQYVEDKHGNKYYMMAIQEWFYPKSQVDKGFTNFDNCRGDLVDVILTSGEVVHFCIVDANAQAHTNGGPMESSLWNVQYVFSPMKLDQYLHIYHAAYGNTIEISGTSWGSGVSGFMKKFGMSLDGNMIAYYRRYKLKLNDAPERKSGVGTDTHFSLGKVKVNANAKSGSNNNSGGSNGGDVLVAEEDLVDMPEYLDLTEKQRQITLPTASSLSIQESMLIDDLRLRFESKSTEDLINRIRVAVAMLGIILIFYAVLFALAYTFDRVNTFFDISMIEFVTFGLIKRDIDEKHDYQIISFRRFIIIEIVFLLVGGVFILGGLIYRVIIWIVGLLDEAIGIFGK